MAVEQLNITKKIDSLGRVVIPKSIRDRLRIYDGDELEIAMIDGWIGLRKVRPEEEEDEEMKRLRIAREVLEEKGIMVPLELRDDWNKKMKQNAGVRVVR